MDPNGQPSAFCCGTECLLMGLNGLKHKQANSPWLDIPRSLTCRMCRIIVWTGAEERRRYCAAPVLMGGVTRSLLWRPYLDGYRRVSLRLLGIATPTLLLKTLPESGLCLLLQVEPNHLGPLGTASPSLVTNTLVLIDLSLFSGTLWVPPRKLPGTRLKYLELCDRTQDVAR
jgi:hypothetical protein